MLKGYKHTIETRERLSSLNKGKRISEEVKRKISLKNTGRVVSDETRKKLSAAHSLGCYPFYRHTEESKKKISEHNVGFKGRHHTTQSKLKTSQTAKEFYKTTEGILKKQQISVSQRKNMIEIYKTEKGIKIKHDLKEKRKHQVLPVKDTSIEVIIQNHLKDLYIDFFTHQYMNIEHSYQCDIFIPALNLVIECDGNYWHKYPVGNDVDHIRTKELIEKGFKVLRLWEIEIRKMSKDELKERINEVSQ